VQPLQKQAPPPPTLRVEHAPWELVVPSVGTFSTQEQQAANKK